MGVPRLAVLVPENNTTVASELPDYFAGSAHCDFFRIPRPKALLTPETLPGYIGSARDIVAGLEPSRFTALVYACTAASFINGRAADLALAAEFHRMSNLPVITTADSMARRLKVLGCRRIGLVTPYSTAVNQSLTGYLGDARIDVARVGRLDAADTEALGRITVAEVETMVRQTADVRLMDGVFVACTQLPTLPFIRTIGPELGLPIVSAVRATVWLAAETAGLDTSDF